jgi:hypothetical protein
VGDALAGLLLAVALAGGLALGLWINRRLDFSPMLGELGDLATYRLVTWPIRLLIVLAALMLCAAPARLLYFALT